MRGKIGDIAGRQIENLAVKYGVRRDGQDGASAVWLCGGPGSPSRGNDKGVHSMRRVSLTILVSLSMLAAHGIAQNITGSGEEK
jgi:hypothetical protein